MNFQGDALQSGKHIRLVVKNSLPEIEFPQNYIKDYNVRHNIILGSLILKVHSKRKKNYSVKVGLFGFSYNQRKSITSSLQNIFISK